MRALHSLWIILLLAGCSLSTDVDGYTFVDSPCPRPARRCEGGDTYWFVTSKGDIARHVDELIDGFDVDGTSEPVCGHPDSVSPDGGVGIDNALSSLLETVEPTLPTPLDENTLNSILSGESLVVLRLENVDDFVNDDCIDFSILRGQVPLGEDPMSYLDANGDRVLDADLTLDYGTVTANDDRACIVDGTLHATQGDTRSIFNSGAAVAELATVAGRARTRITRDKMVDGIQGGGLSVTDIVELLNIQDQPGLVNVLEGAADLYPDSRGDCTHLSYALTFEAIPFTPGSFR
ncbi:MAG: hypothetical protein GXP55_02635 [Deltaproteobacteria bacterium]|nr:hypothetical protein [Deltaproteobacteria bacterium]